MNTKNIISVSAVAALAVLTLGVFELTETIAEDQDKGYKFVEGTSVTARFIFEDANLERVVPFEVVHQKSGFDMDSDTVAIIDLEKVVGETPILHEAADRAHKWSLTEDDYHGKFFDLQVMIHQDDRVLRQFDYRKCTVSDYNVETITDKEEGWIGKTGFVHVDKFEFTCRGYDPNSPVFEELYNEYKKANNISSMDLREPDSTWQDHLRYSNSRK